jgi:hypothetical protein
MVGPGKKGQYLVDWLHDGGQCGVSLEHYVAYVILALCLTSSIQQSILTILMGSHMYVWEK